MEIKNPTKIDWNEVSKVGFPPKELRYQGEFMNSAPRMFLVRNDYQIECAYAFDDGSGFDTSEYFCEDVIAWTIVEGF